MPISSANTTSALVSVVALRRVDAGLAATVLYQCEGDPDEGPHRQHRQRSRGLRTVEEGDRSQAGVGCPNGKVLRHLSPRGRHELPGCRRARTRSRRTMPPRVSGGYPQFRRSKRGRRSPQRSPGTKGDDDLVRRPGAGQAAEQALKRQGDKETGEDCITEQAP